MSTDRWTKQLRHTHTKPMKTGASESVMMRWMNLEPTAQREASQKEKQTSYLNTYPRHLEGTDASVHRAAMERQTQTTDLWTRVGRSGRGWDEWRAQHGGVYANIRKQTANGNVLYDSGNPN